MDPAKELERREWSRQQAIRNASALGDSDVQRFYCGRVVFLTGGSGFLGKQLIEKLLRSCKVSKVYMLLRPKNGKSMQQRLDELVKESVFDIVREEQPNFATKIKALEGDVGELNLGLSDEDFKTITEEVDTLFHVAATTRFYESLRVSTLINLRGTRECLKLGKACKKLRTYIHVSTAYTHATYRLVGEEVQEKFYKSPVPPNAMISMAEEMDEERLSGITEELIKDWPNTYSFTKAIAEELIRTTSDGLPICIVRPGIVMSSYNEPSPGWIDKAAVYSAAGLIMGIGMGVLHVVHCDINVKIGLIPCDFVNNVIIAAGKEAASTQRKGGDHTKIYTVTTHRNPITWRGYAHTLRTRGPKYSTPLALYYTYAIETSSKLMYMILSLFLHVIPAYLADGVYFLVGKERRFVKLSTKVFKISNALSYFINNEWQLVDHNTAKLYDSLSAIDKTEFNFDIPSLNWSDYIIITWCLGIRKHILKDGLKDTNYAINKQTILAIIHYTSIFGYIFFWWKMYCFFFL